MTADDSDEAGTMLESAARTLTPPVGVRTRVYKNVLAEFEQHAHLQSLVTQSQARHNRPDIRWALAASLMIAAGVAFWLLGSSGNHLSNSPWTAKVSYGVLSATDRRVAPGALVQMSAGTRLSTRDTIAELQTGDGTRVRLGFDSILEVQARHLLSLVQGSIYVDNADPTVHLHIKGPGGTITEIGTRYAMRVTGDSSEIALRDGQIELRTTRGEVLQASASTGTGELMRISSAGEVTRQTLPTTDPWWLWAEDAAPPFEVEGESVHAFLEWACHERGLRLRYANDLVALQARQSVLYGVAVSLPPPDALDDVLTATRYPTHRGTGGDGDTIVVDFRR